MAADDHRVESVRGRARVRKRRVFAADCHAALPPRGGKRRGISGRLVAGENQDPGAGKQAAAPGLGGLRQGGAQAEPGGPRFRKAPVNAGPRRQLARPPGCDVEYHGPARAAADIRQGTAVRGIRQH